MFEVVFALPCPATVRPSVREPDHVITHSGKGTIGVQTRSFRLIHAWTNRHISTQAESGTEVEVEVEAAIDWKSGENRTFFDYLVEEMEFSVF